MHMAVHTFLPCLYSLLCLPLVSSSASLTSREIMLTRAPGTRAAAWDAFHAQACCNAWRRNHALPRFAANVGPNDLDCHGTGVCGPMPVPLRPHTPAAQSPALVLPFHDSHCHDIPLQTIVCIYLPRSCLPTPMIYTMPWTLWCHYPVPDPLPLPRPTYMPLAQTIALICPPPHTYCSSHLHLDVWTP